ncbi:MAG: HlyC/CorC family transporter [Leptospiraceae bacterium]|nr:HlyC/CorC family transporter [Leptospiraceae bacterium]MCP5498405.1 HlyC/CorC family transporter [Leptospiraceae bacterium]
MLTFGFFIILLLLFMNGFFVASEFAFVSTRPSKIEDFIKENKPLALVAKKALGKINDILAVCQVGITISSLLIGWLSVEFVAHLVQVILKKYPLLTIPSSSIYSISIAFALVIIVFMHVILGETLPKSFAMRNPESMALKLSLPLFFFYYLFWPITFIVKFLLNRLLGVLQLPEVTPNTHSVEDLKLLLEEHNKQKNLENTDLKLIQKTIAFSNKEAREVMTHRTVMEGISYDVKIKDIVDTIARNNFSRYPVFEKTIDNIVGIIHVQSYFQWLKNPKRNRNATIQSIMQTPVFVPETLSLENILQKMRSAKQHMTIVVDEYGGVAGLLTLEDIIEEIFGSIEDETDDAEDTPIHDMKPNSFVISGEAELSELSDILEGEDMEEYKDVRTIAGLFLEKHQDMPREGSMVTIKTGSLTVEKMEGNKIIDIRYDFAPVNVVPIQEEYD